MIRFLQTPGKAKKFVLSGILLVICVAMVWYLVPSGNSTASADTSNDVLATVGSTKVTYTDVQLLAQGRPMNPFMLQQAVDYLIKNDAMMMEAHRLGLQVSDDELRDELHHGQFGQVIYPEGKYVGYDKYSDFIRGQFNMPVETFENLLKNQLLTQKLESLVTGAAVVTPDEIQREFVKQNEKVKLDYAVITPAQVQKEINPSGPELNAYYQTHQAEFVNSVPEKRKARYVVIDLAKLAAQNPVTNAELVSYYDQHKEDFRQQDEVKASHILVKVEPGVDGKIDPKADAAARAKAEGILKQLKAGANFEELAKKESDDKGSAINGGSLGFFQRGQMVPEFEKVAFSLAPGQMSDLVKTQFGYHIIRVDDKHIAGIPPLAQVKDKIDPIVKQQKAQQRAEQLSSQVESEARSQGLDAAAAKHSLEVVTTDWFGRGDSLPGIGPSRDFMDAVFSAADKAPPQSVPTNQGYVIFQLSGIKPPATPSFEEAKDRVVAQFKAERSQQLLTQKTQELSDRAHALHDLKKAAKELNADFKSSDWLGQQ
ncbi:MAG TPA: peptidylprolyl isomerase, partial [Terriglobales bacterium]|nr:peptidylprolyl isomerase [Terriglobales bacterium]